MMFYHPRLPQKNTVPTEPSPSKKLAKEHSGLAFSRIMHLSMKHIALQDAAGAAVPKTTNTAAADIL